jgi:hypothetical protein
MCVCNIYFTAVEFVETDHVKAYSVLCVVQGNIPIISVSVAGNILLFHTGGVAAD